MADLVNAHSAEDLDVTVHKFSYENAADWAVSDQVLLEDAAALVTSLQDDTRWLFPQSIDFSIFRISGARLQYSATPPHVLCERRPVSQPGCIQDLDWGEPLHFEEDQWSLEDMEPFDHGYLHKLLADAEHQREKETVATSDDVPDVASLTSARADQTHQSATKRKNDSDASVPHVYKRPRMDEGSLADVLPHPHFQACLLTFDNPWPAFMHAEFYPDGPIPIPPHTHTTMEDHLGDQFARLAWVIPVRGDLPWEGATSAYILADPQDDSTPAAQAPLPEAPYKNPDSPTIVWTRDALRTFWQFMLDVKDTDNLGPLSLAFYHPPASHTRSSAEGFSYVGSHKLDSTLDRSSHPQDDSAYEALEPPRSTLCQTAHIKIYHDAPHTKVLRNILNAWAYRSPGAKVRLLKGAKLALLDECNKGLLLC